MTHALFLDGAWRAVPSSGTIINAGGISVSAEGFALWSDSEREGFGARLVPEPPATPEGKNVASRDLGGNEETGPTWIVSYVDAPEPGPERIPEEISDRQFAQALAKLDPPLITKSQALAFVKRGEVPPDLQAAIDAISDPETRFDTDMQVSGATIFQWSHPTTAALGAALNKSPAEMADLWRFAASLP